MGRKGMKGFLKGVHRHQDSDEDAEEVPPGQSGSSTPKPAATQEQSNTQKAKQTTSSIPADKPSDTEDGGDDDSDDNGNDNKGPETRGQLLQRHKREMVAHKKAVQKLGNKNKDEAAKLTAQIEARHARELAELEKRHKQEPSQEQQQPAEALPGSEGAVAEQLAAFDMGAAHTAVEAKKPTKAQRRREKLAQQDADRERRITSEQAAMGPSEKVMEEAQLLEQLLPLRLHIREIRADGHCLYRSLQDQLAQAAAAAPAGVEAAAGTGTIPDYLALRRLAASHIRSHSDDFLPFIFNEDTPGSPEEQLESYCEELEGTAVWGGQLELGALAQALKKQIKVYAAGMPTVTLGDEHAAEGVLQLCYLRHAFGLGEHYNSVTPLC